MKVTIAEFATAQGVSAGVANGFVNFLVEKGEASKTDESRKPVDENGESKRGRPSAVYEIPETVTLNLG